MLPLSYSKFPCTRGVWQKPAVTHGTHPIPLPYFCGYRTWCLAGHRLSGTAYNPSLVCGYTWQVSAFWPMFGSGSGMAAAGMCPYSGKDLLLEGLSSSLLAGKWM